MESTGNNNKNNKTIESINLSDDLLVMLDLCTNTLVHYSSIIKSEHVRLKETEYGDELFFEFEDYFNSLTGISTSIVKNKKLSLSQISYIKDIKLENKPAIDMFLKDTKNWNNLPGTASELILWKYLMLLIKEWMIKSELLQIKNNNDTGEVNANL